MDTRLPVRPSRAGDVLAYLRLARPSDALIVAFGTVVGARLAGIAVLGDPLVVQVALVSTLLFVASVMINDCWDVRADAVNKPARPIPSGLVTPAQAAAIGFLLFWVAIAVAGMVSGPYALLTGMMTLLSVAYTMRLKNVPFVGNTVVGAVAASPLWCWALLAPAMTDTAVILSLGCVVFRVGAEVVKTSEDYAGDACSGVRTVATTRGVAPANRLGSGLMFVGLLSCCFPVVNGDGGIIYGLLLVASFSLLALPSVRAARLSMNEVDLGRSLVAAERRIMPLMTLAFLAIDRHSLP